MVSENNIRAESYPAIRSHVLTALSNASINDVTVVTSFPKSTADLPALVIPMHQVPQSRLALSSSFMGVYRINVSFEVFTTTEGGQGPAKLATIIDALQTYFNSADLKADNLRFEFLESGEPVRFDLNNQTLYSVGGVMVFTLVP